MENPTPGTTTDPGRLPALTTWISLGDAAAAAAITKATATITTNKKRTAGAALMAASIAAKANKSPIIIGEDTGIDDDGTAVTETTQDQMNEINRIQANLGNYKTSINGMSNFFCKLGHTK